MFGFWIIVHPLVFLWICSKSWFDMSQWNFILFHLISSFFFFHILTWNTVKVSLLIKCFAWHITFSHLLQKDVTRTMRCYMWKHLDCEISGFTLNYKHIFHLILVITQSPHCMVLKINCQMDKWNPWPVLLSPLLDTKGDRGISYGFL